MNKKVLLASALLLISAVGIAAVSFIKIKKNTATSPDDLKQGDAIFPLGNNVNVRSTPNVEANNYIYYNYVGKIGVYLESVLGKDGFVWHKVRLDKPTGNHVEGYVRIDVVKKG